MKWMDERELNRDCDGDWCLGTCDAVVAVVVVDGKMRMTDLLLL
jgi:predicted metal-binding membrane protein